MRVVSRSFIALTMGAVVLGCTESPPVPAGSVTEYLQKPTAYTSKGGLLHLRVRAIGASSSINGENYDGMLIYDTEVLVGTTEEGDASSYVGPEWRVNPGDQLVVDYINELPPYSFNGVKGKVDGLNQPINLHTHGLTVSPAGNADNVLLSIPSGRSNQYFIDIPNAQHEGLYWYHPHIHGLTDDQVYNGLAGHIVVGRADGNYKEFDGLEIVPMMIRYNVRKADKGHLVDASSTDVHGTALDTDGGRMIYTVNGLVSPKIRIRAADASAGTQAESQIWAFTNITGSASYILALDEVAAADANNVELKGTPLDIVIVSVDGSPMPKPVVLTGKTAKGGYHLPQGGRVAILVQGASDPGKVVRVVQLQNRSGSGDRSSFDFEKGTFIGGWRNYTRTVLVTGANTEAPMARHVDTPSMLMPHHPVSVPNIPGEPTDYSRTFIFNDVNNGKPGTDESPSEFPINGAVFPYNRVDQPRVGTIEEWTILNHSSLTHPFHFHTQYGQVKSITVPKDDAVDPEYEAIAPDGTKWGLYATLQYVTDMAALSPASFTQDVVGVPPALIGKDGNPVMNGLSVAQPGSIAMRLMFLNYLGTYVEHCHRLPHEDRGMMSLVRSIPKEPVVASASAAITGTDTTVTVTRTSDRTTIATLTPFMGFSGSLKTAVGDVDGDTVPDVAVASGAGRTAAVRVYLGADMYTKTLLMSDLAPFGTEMNGASVALGDLNGDHKDDIIVGEGAGGKSRVVIFDAEGGTKLAEFEPYYDDAVPFTGGVNVAAGMAEAGGRVSFFVAPGAGRAPEVKMYNVDLFGDAQGVFPDVHKTLTTIGVATFNGADGAAAGYQGGLSIATGYSFAAKGGFARVMTSTLSGPAKLNVYIVGDMNHTDMVAVSGVHRAMPYYAGDKRMAMREGATTELGTLEPALAAGAVVGVYSTVDGAVLLAVPVAGGSAIAWNVKLDGSGFVSAGPWGMVGGDFVAGM